MQLTPIRKRTGLVTVALLALAVPLALVFTTGACGQVTGLSNDYLFDLQEDGGGDARVERGVGAVAGLVVVATEPRRAAVGVLARVARAGLVAAVGEAARIAAVPRVRLRSVAPDVRRARRGGGSRLLPSTDLRLEHAAAADRETERESNEGE